MTYSSLTRCSGKTERGRWSAFDWEGLTIRVFDSAYNSLKIIALFRDESVDPVTKEYVLLQLLFPDPKAVTEKVKDLQGLIAMVVWETCGLDITGEHKDETDGEKVFDWEHDAEVIKVSLFAAYGRSWEEISHEMSYRDVVSMMGLIEHDTPLGQAIYYRTASPPKPSEHNREYLAAWRERQEFWRLEDNRKPASHMEAANNVANDIFAAMEKAAKDGERRNRNNQSDTRR